MRRDPLQVETSRICKPLAATEQEHASGGKRSRKRLVQPPLGRGRQVDGDVAAEDEPPPAGRRTVDDEVATLEADARPDFRGDDLCPETGAGMVEILVEDVAAEQARSPELGVALQDQ